MGQSLSHNYQMFNTNRLPQRHPGGDLPDCQQAPGKKIAPFFKAEFVSKSSYTNQERNMDFYDGFRLMVESARQNALLRFTRIILGMLREQENLFFPEFLIALSEYTMQEQGREAMESEVRFTWGIVSKLLVQAASESEKMFRSRTSGSNCNQSSLSIQAIELASETLEKFTLLEVVQIWLQVLESKRYHFADLLNALSRYAEAETERNPESIEGVEGWKVVAEILRTAAKAAEREGGEIP